jgi:ribosomal-protein-alanine N-acetyltransferase
MMKLKSKMEAKIKLAPISRTRKNEFLSLAKKSRSFHRGWVQAPTTGEQFEKFIKRARQKTSKSYFVLDRLTKQVVGVINLSQIVRGFFQSAYIGYYVFKSLENKGYMSLALHSVLEEAFTKLKLHRLEANIQPSNKPSKNIVERLGFRLEGFSPRYLQIEGKWRDHERWAITLEDWKKVKSRLKKKGFI